MTRWDRLKLPLVRGGIAGIGIGSAINGYVWPAIFCAVIWGIALTIKGCPHE